MGERTVLNKAISWYQGHLAGRGKLADGEGFAALMRQQNNRRGASNLVGRMVDEAIVGHCSSLAAFGAALTYVSTVNPTLGDDGIIAGQVRDPRVAELINVQQDGLLHFNTEKHISPLTSLALVASGLISFFTYMKLFSSDDINVVTETSGSGWGATTTSTASLADPPHIATGHRD